MREVFTKFGILIYYILMTHGRAFTAKVGLVALLIAWSAAPAARGGELIQLGHVELYTAYSEIKGGDTDLGTDLSGYYAPTLKFDDTLFLIPLYSASFNRVEQFLPQEEGNVFYNTYMVHNFNLALRKEFKPGWFWKVGALGTWNFMRASDEEKWGKGLYDYRDAGAVVEVKHQVQKEKVVNTYLAAIEYYRRQYPNFATLISSASVTPPERREKDYDAYKTKFRAEGVNAKGLCGYLEGRYTHKFFLDKHLVCSDGTLDMKKQRTDYMVEMDGGFSAPIPLPWEGLSFSFDTNYTHNFSNLAFYDDRGSVPLGDDVYTPRYFGYGSFSVTPAVEYKRALGEEKLLRFRLGYGFMQRAYSHRKKQFAVSGAYTGEEQLDRQYEYFALLSIPLTKKIAWVTKYSWVTARSNQKFETYYRYNYDYQNIRSGISWDF